MKKLFVSLATIYSALWMVGCNQNSGGNNVATPVGYCATGQVWNGYVCVNNNGTTVTPGTVQYYDYNRAFSAYGNTVAVGDMQIVNNEAYKAFLREAMALCDRNIWGWEAGLAKCDNWTSGSFRLAFSINVNTKIPTLRFEAYPAPSFFQGFINIGIDGGGAAFNPLILFQNNTYSLINDSKGFELRAQGSYWNGGGLRLIQVQVANGTLNDSYFEYDLYYPYNNVATKIAHGKFKRY